MLASGEIVYASNQTNPDLFQVLKGGTSNFGVVTRYDLQTFPAPGLWGGVVTYSNSTTEQQLQAIKNFGDNISSDPNASAICIWQYSSTTNSTIVINAYDYTEPVERPPVYDEFYEIQGNTSDSMRITNMTDLVNELEQPAGFRYVRLSGAAARLTVYQGLFHHKHLCQRHSRPQKGHRAPQSTERSNLGR